jgi:hypothetical protein
MTARLHPDDLELLADLVAERLTPLLERDAPAGDLVDVKTIARMLSVTPSFVYEHAPELGGRKVGTGPKAPWRFDPEQARAGLSRPEPSQPERRPVPRRRRRTPTSVPLLPIRGRDG